MASRDAGAGLRSREVVDRAALERSRATKTSIEALAAGSIVRTHVLRPTWHFVARDDLRWLLALSGPRVQQGSAGRYRELGLDARTRARGEKVIVSALEGGNRLTRKELAAVLDDSASTPRGQRMPYLLMSLRTGGLIGSGGLAGKQQTYALLDERVPAGGRFDRDDALVELVRRYLTSHGPATVKDMSWWSGLTMTDLRTALELIGDEVQSETVDGMVLWSTASDDSSPPAPRGGTSSRRTMNSAWATPSRGSSATPVRRRHAPRGVTERTRVACCS